MKHYCIRFPPHSHPLSQKGVDYYVFFCGGIKKLQELKGAYKHDFTD